MLRKKNWATGAVMNFKEEIIESGDSNALQIYVAFIERLEFSRTKRVSRRIRICITRTIAVTRGSVERI